jgi:DNA-binding MarR family transcriptional regulator
MSGTSPDFFDQNSEPLAQQIATGLSKVGLALKHQARQDAGESGLSPTQSQILAILADGPRRPSEVAARMAISLPTVSESVRALVDKGLVKKVRDERDARATVLHLTARGRRAASASMGWPDFLASAVEAMSPLEQEVFFTGLIKMIRMLQERGQIPVSGMCVSCTHFRPHVYASSERPHHCALVDAPFGTRHLRLDCPEQTPAEEATREANWQRFVTLPVLR